MIAIILLRENPASYVAKVYDGDVLIDEIVGATVPEVKRRVKKAYGIDCE